MQEHVRAKRCGNSNSQRNKCSRTGRGEGQGTCHRCWPWVQRTNQAGVDWKAGVGVVYPVVVEQGQGNKYSIYGFLGAATPAVQPDPSQCGVLLTHLKGLLFIDRVQLKLVHPFTPQLEPPVLSCNAVFSLSLF